MTRLISILLVLAAVWVGFKLFHYWQTVRDEKEDAERKAAAAIIKSGEQLSGMPYQLEGSLRTATENGAIGLRNWLSAYAGSVQDPRLAWIELDYCVMASRSHPAEAKQVFAAVKERTPTNSPVYYRIRQLEKTFD
jgi:hypothetical protein